MSSSNISDPNTVPVTHGANMVANASFGTVVIVSLILLIVALIVGQPPLVYAALATGMLGGCTGYLLWHYKWYLTATTFHTGNLIVSGLLSYIGSNSIGGATGVLFLASVITAGGLLGWKAAVIDSVVVFIAVWIALQYGVDLRMLLHLPIQGEPAPELLHMVFILSSVPCWGMYVVAIDASNREAWRNAYRSNQQLEQQNQALITEQEKLAQAKNQQALVASISVLANTEVSIETIEKQCVEALSKFIPNLSEWGMASIHTMTDQDIQNLANKVSPDLKDFTEGITQVLLTSRSRERILREKQRLSLQLQKEQKFEALSRMAGGVAHDFNNALMVITGQVDELSVQSSIDEEAHKKLDTILLVSKHAKDMTDQLLLFAKGVPLQDVKVDVSMAVQTIQPILSKIVPAEIVLSYCIPQMQVAIFMPIDHVQRILINLVQNAVRACQEKVYVGSVTGHIAVSLEHIPDKTHKITGTLGRVEIRVQDNGKGMSENTLEHAFEPYFSTKQSTGLGLSTVLGLVERVRGEVILESQEDIGTTIRCVLPVYENEQVTKPSFVPSNENRILQNSSRPNASSEKPSLGRILLIDDDEMVRQAVETMLCRLGWTVWSASGKQEALDVVVQKTDKVQCILCDIRLGSEEGFEVVDALRMAGLQNVPVVYITGYSGEYEEQLQMHEALLVKPFRLAELKDAILNIVASASSLV